MYLLKILSIRVVDLERDGVIEGGATEGKEATAGDGDVGHGG